ncbi:biosynthetic-type acetolactate synthase large subunit [Candidatus Bathyarchaeota archaeon]|nr:biosynthetic-type acetolactate synthase large subunit [Candidatus Bathyarchaeota archaeon]
MNMMTGAQILVEALKKEGVDVIFGLPGGAILPVFDVLYDSDIRFILVRHEQCSAHMAEGYAKASGRVGVCMVTSGPGATNLVTGITDAYMDSVPIVAFTGQVPRSMIGKDGFQEADIIGITMPITKYNVQIRSAKEIPYEVKKAFFLASTGRTGPVLIDLPKDTQTETTVPEFPEKVSVRGYHPDHEPHPLQVKKAAQLLLKGEKPLILAGGGVISSNASPELMAVAEHLVAPVATSLMGKGAIPENHPLSLGVLGMHGTREANKLILEADLLLAVGLRFSDRTTGKFDEFASDCKIIHIDIDAAEIGKNVPADIPLVTDAKRGLKDLYKALTELSDKKDNTTWMKRVQELRDLFRSEPEVKDSNLKPPKLMKELRSLLPPDTIVTTEVGQNQMWASLFFKVYKPRTFITSGGLGTMGFGFPAAIGAKVAVPNVPVVDIAGDGSFIMTEQELACSVTEEIPVVVLVLNNRMLGMVAQWQRLFYQRRYSAVELGDVPDFVKLAEAYGAQGMRVQSYEEFRKAVNEAVKSEVTTVIDVPISPEENVFPMVPAGKSLRETITGE